jgi:hypothetical protein
MRCPLCRRQCQAILSGGNGALSTGIFGFICMRESGEITTLLQG